CSPPPPSTPDSPLSLHDALPISPTDTLSPSATSSTLSNTTSSPGSASSSSRRTTSPSVTRCCLPPLEKTANIIRLALYMVWVVRSEEHTSELQSRENLVCRLLLE